MNARDVFELEFVLPGGSYERGIAELRRLSELRPEPVETVTSTTFREALDARLREPMRPLTHPEVLGKLLPSEPVETVTNRETLAVFRGVVSAPPLTREELDATIKRVAEAASNLTD